MHDINDTAILSIDFIIGFTIFMVAFIIVVTMTSGLLIGLSSKTVDYNAVAYRTGAILAEDPGYALISNGSTTWERIDQYHSANILRLGLALSKDTPNILSPEKINHFFSTDPAYFSYSAGDYNQKLVFGDYPYRFNITLTPLNSSMESYSVGEAIPNNYGYIRRLVKIKQPNYVIYNASNPNYLPVLNPSQFSIDINMTDIYHSSYVTSEYQLDPLNDGINITILNMNFTTNSSWTSQADPSNPTPAVLTAVQLVKDGTVIPPVVPITVNGSLYSTYSPVNPYFYATPINVENKTVNLTLDSDYFAAIEANEFSQIDLNFIFSSPNRLIGHTYNSIEVNQAPFIPAVLEVRVW
jgi:hypothetical protein